MQNVYLYGTNTNGTPIRPDYSSRATKLRAELMPTVEKFITLQLLQTVELVDIVEDDITEVIELDEVA